VDRGQGRPPLNEVAASNRAADGRLQAAARVVLHPNMRLRSNKPSTKQVHWGPSSVIMKLAVYPVLSRFGIADTCPRF
jgi:uncharacterized heparinase superfamily protein